MVVRATSRERQALVRQRVVWPGSRQRCPGYLGVRRTDRLDRADWCRATPDVRFSTCFDIDARP